MSQPFNRAVITNAGTNLLTRAQAGETTIQFTRVVIGDGVYDPEEKNLSVLQKMTGLKSQKNSYLISKVDVHSEHGVKITALITNQNPETGEVLISEGYYINEIGLYAKEKDGEGDTEVLYSITVTAGDKGDFMPPYNGYDPAQIVQNYIIKVNEAAEITMQAGNGAVALEEDLKKLEEYVTKALKDIMEKEENSDISNADVTFEKAERRENISSGEKLAVIAGKIERFFADLKSVAFSGDYDDLENKPDIQGMEETASVKDNDYMVIGGEINKKITWANIIKMIIAKLTGGVSTILTNNMTANRVMVSDANGKASVSAGITTTILNYLSGLTSNVQSQIDTLSTTISGKQSTITGAATTIVSKNLTASRALVADSQGKVAASSTTSTELGYIHGVTSAVQTQFNNLREISVNPVYQNSGYWNTGNLNVIRPGIWWINGYGSVTNAPFATHFVMIGQGYNGACLNQVAIDMSTAKVKVRHRDNVNAAWQSWAG